MPRAGWGLLIRDTGDSVFRYTQSDDVRVRRDRDWNTVCQR